jgi:hypothetical protein
MNVLIVYAHEESMSFNGAMKDGEQFLIGFADGRIFAVT